MLRRDDTPVTENNFVPAFVDIVVIIAGHLRLDIPQIRGFVGENREAGYDFVTIAS
jgi:hypothetical protein